MTLLDRAIVRLLPAVPRPVVQMFSARYIAGPDARDAVRVVKQLNADGKLATIDVLGEEITNEEEARAIVRAYRDVFDEIERERLDSNVSVKLTALGLGLSYDTCRANLEDVVRQAAEERGNFVRIDMEDSSTTDDTLRLYRELREAGHENLGVVLQAYLRRTLDDIDALADLRPNVRLCKGIYVEPPSIAFTDADAIRANFVRCLDALLDAGAYVGVATHDEWLIGQALRIVGERGLERDDYEFQMLLGVREQRASELVAAGHRLRVYVPFGEQWYATRCAGCRRTRPWRARSRARPSDACSAAAPGPGRSPLAQVARRSTGRPPEAYPVGVSRCPARRGIRRGCRSVCDRERQPVVLAARVSPPAHIRVLHIPVAAADRRTRTCNARGSNRQAGPVERKLAPVACEQPPRSKVILTFEGGLFGNGH